MSFRSSVEAIVRDIVSATEHPILTLEHEGALVARVTEEATVKLEEFVTLGKEDVAAALRESLQSLQTAKDDALAHIAAELSKLDTAKAATPVVSETEKGGTV